MKLPSLLPECMSRKNSEGDSKIKLSIQSDCFKKKRYNIIISNPEQVEKIKALIKEIEKDSDEQTKKKTK
jgi:hypothetical protein